MPTPRPVPTGPIPTRPHETHETFDAIRPGLRVKHADPTYHGTGTVIASEGDDWWSVRWDAGSEDGLTGNAPEAWEASQRTASIVVVCEGCDDPTARTTPVAGGGGVCGECAA